MRGRLKPPFGKWVPPSKENDHLAMLVVMMVVVPPPMLLEMLVVVMMVIHAVGRRRTDGTGERAGGDENGNEA